MYKFESIEQLSNFRYYVKQKYDKKASYLYYTSYTSIAEDLNDATFEKLRKHKEAIDLAMSMVERQYKQGLRYPIILYPRGFNDNYKYYVYKYVEAKIKKNETCRKAEYQPYWIYDKVIRSYEFRANKGLMSKFQCFVEFEPSYSKNDTIKLNLAMSKKGYEQRNTIYRDGFDLVYDFNAIKVRHISEEIVAKKKDTKIERHVTIDAWGNIYSALIDKNETNLNEKNQPRFNVERKLIVGKLNIFRRTSKVKGLLNYVNKYYKDSEAHLFYNRLQVIRQGVKVKLDKIIGKDNESDVQILVMTDANNNIFKEINKTLEEVAKDIASKRGINLKIVRATGKEIATIVKKHKQDSNAWSLQHKGYGVTYSDVNDIKWQDSLIASIKLKYKEYYPMLAKNKKSLKKFSKTTDRKGYQVQKPDYISYEEFKNVYFNWSGIEYNEKECRKLYVNNVKSIAIEYCRKISSNASETDDEIIFV